MMASEDMVLPPYEALENAPEIKCKNRFEVRILEHCATGPYVPW